MSEPATESSPTRLSVVVAEAIRVVGPQSPECREVHYLPRGAVLPAWVPDGEVARLRTKGLVRTLEITEG